MEIVYAFLLWLQYDNEIYIKFVIYISKFILGIKKTFQKGERAKYLESYYELLN